MTQPPKKLFIVSTESSGDFLGARMVQALQGLHPNLNIRGVAGPQLEELGVDPIYRVTDFNVMGLVEVLRDLKRLKKQFNHLVEELKAWRPDAVVLIDAPDFNIRFAKAISHLGIPIIYYVSPQVWAWRKGRSRQIAESVSKMLVLFPFEVNLYSELGLETHFVGHPLVDEIQKCQLDPKFDETYPPTEKPMVVLGPGSRRSEIEKLLPIMADVARKQKAFDFRLPLVPHFPLERARELLGDSPVTICQGEFRQLMLRARAAVIASGTATLETALFGVPMVVGYKLHSASYWIAKRLVKVPHIAMANLILEERVFPELVQGDFTSEKIMEQLEPLVVDGERREIALKKLLKIPGKLAGEGAARRAAEHVLRSMS